MKHIQFRAVAPRLSTALVLAPLVFAAACSEQKSPASSSHTAQAPATTTPAPAAAEHKATDPATAQQAPEQKVADQRAADQKVAADQKTAEQKAAEQKMADRMAAAQQKPDAAAATPARAQAVTAEADLKAKEAEQADIRAKSLETGESKVDPAAAAGSSLAQGTPAAPTGPAPRLDSDTTDHDFGTAIEGEKLSHTFKLKSSGQADLVITNAKPTCGCTIAKLEIVKADGSAELYKMGDPCPPGTELRLTAELDTKNAHGTKSSKINVYCNDPRTLLTLGLNARVDTYFVLTPNALQFGDLSVADSVEKSFQVAGKKPEPFKLNLDNKQLPDGMKIDITPVEPTPEGKATRWDCKVTLGPNCKEGNLGFPIQLRSDEKVTGAQPDKDGNTPTYGASVMVTARVQGLISWDPQYLSFGLVRPGQSVARSLSIKSFDPNFSFGEPKVRLVGPSDQKPEFAYGDSFSYVVKPSEDKKSVTVELTLNGLPESVDGSFQGRLMIETGHTVKPEIAVLFSGVCRPGVKATPAPTPTPADTTPPKNGQGGQ